MLIPPLEVPLKGLSSNLRDLPVRVFPPVLFCGGCGGGNSFSIFFNTTLAIHFMSSSFLSGHILGGMLFT